VRNHYYLNTIGPYVDFVSLVGSLKL